MDETVINGGGACENAAADRVRLLPSASSEVGLDIPLGV